MKSKSVKFAFTALSALIVGCSSTNEAVTFTAEDLVDPTGTPGEQWKLVWNDEFDGEEINPHKWNHEENCWGGGNNEQQCYTDRKVNSFVDNGVLHLVAKKGSFTGVNNPDGKSGAKTTLPYTSARLNSKNKREWKYGRFEVRAMLPHGQGTWPAIWMLPTDNVYGTWAASGEIDIMEAVNLKTQSDHHEVKEGDLENRVHGTLHYGRQWPKNVSSGTEYTLPIGINPADGFHTYAIEWEEGEIRWYVDNIHFATQRQDGWYAQYEQDGRLTNAPESAPFNEKFHLVLNLAVGGNWAGNTNEGGVDSSIFPQTLAVDYVRVYRCNIDRWKGKGCGAVSETAKFVPGNATPEIILTDENYGKEMEIVFFDDQMHKYLYQGRYDPQENMSAEFVEEAGRGQVFSVVKTGESGNVYFSTPDVDLSRFKDNGELVFDIKVMNNEADSDLLVKIDSGWPAAGDALIDLSDKASWQEVRVKIADIVSNGNSLQPGATVDLKAVANILVIEPTGPVELMFDNIRIIRK